MKEDEKELARFILGGRNGYAAEVWWDSRGWPDKRFYRLLEKWMRKGWWEYGVSLCGGWLTQDGRAALAAATTPTAP